MSFFWKRSIILLVVLVAVLQVVHIALLSRLEAKRSAHKPVSYEEDVEFTDIDIKGDYSAEKLVEDRRRLLDRIADSHIMDTSGELMICQNLFRPASYRHKLYIPSSGSVSFGVTLISHTSLAGLHHLSKLATNWNGPISIALFVTSKDLVKSMDSAILLYRYCPQIQRNTTLHLVFPIGLNPLKLSSSASVDHFPANVRFDCDNLSASLHSVNENTINYGATFPYPNNVLRNVGRKFARTNHVFVIDIDILPNRGLHDEYVQFALLNKLDELKTNNVAYVVPVFEIDDQNKNLRMPENKTALLKLLQEKKCRPFYVDVCWKCHRFTDYEAWQRQPQAIKMSILYNVEWQDPWEPFYIVDNQAPFYDERFKQYGFNRISQICELNVAGFKFSVLNNAFLVHQGLKRADSFHVNKDEELERNRFLFRQFKNELKVKYQTSRRC